MASSKILLGVSGGIAAYKAADLLHSWIKMGFEAETIMTSSAEAFVSPLVLSTLGKRRVWQERDFLSPEYGWQIPHIKLTEWADIFVIAPCTANALRIAAEGDASTLLGAALSANTKPLLICPAMNGNMLSSEPVKHHIETLKSRGAFIVDPDTGVLACGYEGKGRLPSVDVINDYVKMLLEPKKDLRGKRVVITAGPTHEYIDPVRFISNPSSGKMGYALAHAAFERGADVTLVSGPSALRKPSGVRVINVTSADEMYEACMALQENADIIIKSAAVGDYRAAEKANQKIKRGNKDVFELKLVQNRDIAAALGKNKRSGQILVGFAAETEHILENALAKLEKKNLDIVVSNDVTAAGAGFASNTNIITVTNRNGYSEKFSGSKEEAAHFIFDAVLR